MIVNTALAALTATGLVVPEKPQIILPKPALVRAENIEMSRHVLLGMPLMMGKLAKGSGGGTTRPTFISATSVINTTGPSFTTSLTIPTGAQLLVCAFAVRYNNVASTLNSITFDLGAMTAASAWGATSNRSGTGVYYRALGGLGGTRDFTIAFSNNTAPGIHARFYWFSTFNASTPIGVTASQGNQSGNTQTITRTPTSSKPFMLAVYTTGGTSNSYSSTNVTIDQIYASTSSWSSAIGSNGTLDGGVSTSFTITYSSFTDHRMTIVELQSS